MYEHGQAIKKEYRSIAWAYKDEIRKTRARAGAETERHIGSKKKLNKRVWVHWQQMEDLRKWFPLMDGAGNLILRMKADTKDVFISVFIGKDCSQAPQISVPSSRVQGRKLHSTTDNRIRISLINSWVYQADSDKAEFIKLGLCWDHRIYLVLLRVLVCFPQCKVSLKKFLKTHDYYGKFLLTSKKRQILCPFSEKARRRIRWAADLYSNLKYRNEVFTNT